jgi:hypothetical protein
MPRLLWLVILVVIWVIICALIMQRNDYIGGDAIRAAIGGAAAAAKGTGALSALMSPHVVVDTLNIANVIHAKVGQSVKTKEKIMDTIRTTAPVLKKRHAGRVMYVLKDRDGTYNTLEAREEYKKLAAECEVYIYVVERYIDEPASAGRAGVDHADKGRDDFYACILANKWRCAVLTEDRYSDFSRFRARVKPFHVYEYAYWRAAVERDYIRPESPAYSRLRRPARLRYDDYFGEDVAIIAK